MHVAHEGHPKEHDAGLYGAIRRFRKPFEWSRPQTRTILAGLLATAGVATVGVVASRRHRSRRQEPTPWVEYGDYY